MDSMQATLIVCDMFPDCYVSVTIETSKTFSGEYRQSFWFYVGNGENFAQVKTADFYAGLQNLYRRALAAGLVKAHPSTIAHNRLLVNNGLA